MGARPWLIACVRSVAMVTVTVKVGLSLVSATHMCLHMHTHAKLEWSHSGAIQIQDLSKQKRLEALDDVLVMF
jgi:hypothetical protein